MKRVGMRKTVEAAYELSFVLIISSTLGSLMVYLCKYYITQTTTFSFLIV